MRKLLTFLIALVLTIGAVAGALAFGGGSGISNPGANSIGDYQGIDNGTAASSPSGPTCTYTPVTTGTQNSAYTGATPSASGGTPTYTFSETGSLPSGLTISSSTGVISGTPTVSGSFPSIQVVVTDSASKTANCGSAFTLVISPAAGNQIAFDAASTFGTGSTTTTQTVTLTTTKTNDVVVLCTQSNTSSINSVSDTAGLTWNAVGAQAGTVRAFYAKASSVLSSDTITVTYSSSQAGGFVTVLAAAFSGVNATPIDANGALPGTTTTGGTPLTLTTSNANDLLFACYALNGSASAGSGWTSVPGADTSGFDQFEYQIVTSTQSATPANVSSNSQIKNGMGSALVSQ